MTATALLWRERRSIQNFFVFQFVLWHQTLQRLRHIYPTYVPIFNRLNLTRVPEFHHACIMNTDFHVF